ncbi:hypothetical protein N7486_000963 [Penicillium sp. IBT 16267x]|nr:hypothetical protein N7486_000963 [Penicillium sp. IBT 16267x]
MWKHHKIVQDQSVCMNQHSMNAYPIQYSWGTLDTWYWDLREKPEVPASVQRKLQDGTAEIEDVQGGVELPSEF